MKPGISKNTKNSHSIASKSSKIASTSYRSKKPQCQQTKTNPMSSFDPFPNSLLTKTLPSSSQNVPPFHPPSHHQSHNPKPLQAGTQYTKISSNTALIERGGNFQKPSSGYQQSTNKKKRQVIKKDQINRTGSNPVISHKRNISANVPYQAITNHTLSNLNRPSPSIGSVQTANYLNLGGSAISGRCIKLINNNKPQLLLTSQLLYSGNQTKTTSASNACGISNTRTHRSKLQSTLSLVQMLKSDNIQSARSAFAKPLPISSSQPTSTKNINHNQQSKIEFYQVDNSLGTKNLHSV